MNKMTIPYVCIATVLLLSLPFGLTTSDSTPRNGGTTVTTLELKEAQECSNYTCSLPLPTTRRSGSKPPRPKDLSQDCLSDVECSELPAYCLICDYNISCIYGAVETLSCKPNREATKCRGAKFFNRKMVCQYCYQMPEENYVCSGMAGCNARTAPRQYYRANCTTNSHVHCLGERQFSKNLPCNWTSGFKWSTALILSITLGGFGADRFYLGHWQEGIGKLFSFGGLGVWTLIDVVLIAIGYLGPADGSLYV